MNHHSLLKVAFCGSVLSLLCGFAFTYKSEEDAIESHLFSRTFVLSGNPDSAIYVMKLDLNRDGREEYMVGDDQPALNDSAFSGDNEISFSLHIESRYQPGIGGGGIVSWYRNNPAVLVSRLESIEDPVLLAPHWIEDETRGRETGRDGWFFRYSLHVITKDGIVDSSRWLEDIYPGKTRKELDALFQELAKTGKRLDDYSVYKIRDLAKKLNILTYEDGVAILTGKGDPGYRMIGPGLPEDGVSLTREEVRRLGPRNSLATLDRFKPSPTTGTLMSISASAGTTAAHPPTSHTLEAPALPSSPKPTPATRTPARADSAPRGSESHILQILIAAVAALVVLGGVFAYSRRRR